MTLSKGEIQGIANLARIDLDEQGQQKFEEEINRILEMIAEMQQVDTTNVAPVSHPLGGGQRLRGDKVCSRDNRKLVMPNAPSAEAGFFLVPKVIE